METLTISNFGTLSLEDMGMAGLSAAETDAVLSSFFHLRNKAPSILIVDDDIELSWLLETGLRRFMPTAEITVANDPYEGLNLLLEKEFSFVVLDWNLQGINGLEMLHRAEEEMELDLSLSDKRFFHRPKVVVLSVESPEKCKIDRLEHFKPVGHVSKMQRLDALLESLYQRYKRD